nr:MAG TPA: hypothetical protein [Crassvirales sp.]
MFFSIFSSKETSIILIHKTIHKCIIILSFSYRTYNITRAKVTYRGCSSINKL